MGLLGWKVGIIIFEGVMNFFFSGEICVVFISEFESVMVIFVVFLFSDGMYGVHVVWLVGLDCVFNV